MLPKLHQSASPGPHVCFNLPCRPFLSPRRTSFRFLVPCKDNCWAIVSAQTACCNLHANCSPILNANSVKATRKQPGRVTATKVQDRAIKQPFPSGSGRRFGPTGVRIAVVAKNAPPFSTRTQAILGQHALMNTVHCEKLPFIHTDEWHPCESMSHH